jgi:hypothetical protein
VGARGLRVAPGRRDGVPPQAVRRVRVALGA